MNELLKKMKQCSFPSLPIKLNQFLGASRLNQSSHLIKSSLLVATAATVTFWGLKILQIPANLFDQTIYSQPTSSSNTTINNSKSLFGDIQLATQHILLRGIVITSSPSNSLLDGFAIFEVNGKPSTAISIGETIGNGVTLKKINQESVTMTYLGQDLEYALTTTKNTTNPIPHQ